MNLRLNRDLPAFDQVEPIRRITFAEDEMIWRKMDAIGEFSNRAEMIFAHPREEWMFGGS